MSELIHYSANAEINLQQINMGSVESEQGKQRLLLDNKPIGLCFAVGDGWEKWCIEEEFGLDRLKYQHKVILREDANILGLHDVEQLYKFEDEYLYEPFKQEMDEVSSRTRFTPRPIRVIDWLRVMKEYDGFILWFYESAFDIGVRDSDIAINVKTGDVGFIKGRMPETWYMSRDCATGWVWNIDAIESFTRVNGSC